MSPVVYIFFVSFEMTSAWKLYEYDEKFAH